MDIINTTSRKREIYQIQLQYSPLWECALGIAAVTNTPLHDSLERSREYWQNTKKGLSRELLHHLELVEMNNTWKALLQLLHVQEFSLIDEFIHFIRELPEEKLKYYCVPFLGEKHELLREAASTGRRDAINQLKEMTKNNPFFPAYIDYICTAEAAFLKKHFITVIAGWYESVIQPEVEQTIKILRTDYESKKQMLDTMNPEELVQWATGGVTYTPEPSVHHVLLIPQYVYRPWNIEADIAGTKVFYYPIANESITPHDKYTPSNFLVLKHKALGDEARLRMVKMLIENDRSLQELAEQLDIGKSTTHHHLKILRAAKLVEVKDARYYLKKNAIELLTKELELFLGQ